MSGPGPTTGGRRLGLSPAAVLFAALFAAQAAILVVSPILPQVADEFGISTSAAAQLRSVSGITAGVVALVLAVTGDRFRLGALLGTGLGIIGAGSAASAVAPSFPVLLAAQAVIGLGLAMVLSGGLAASEAWAGEGQGARVLSWALVGQPVAWVVGQPVVGLVAGADWRWAWVAVPAASSAVAMTAVALRRRTADDAGRDCDPLGLWKLPGVRRWALGELLAFSAWTGTLVYSGVFFIEGYGVSVGVTGIILGLVAAAYVPGNFAGRRALSRGPGVLLVGLGLAAAAMVVVYGAVRPGTLFSVAALAVLSFLAAGRTIAGAARGLALAEGRRMAAMSVRTSMLQFGYLAGSAVGGAVFSWWGFAGMGWVFGALFLLSAIVHAPAEGVASARDIARLLRRSPRLTPGG